jgi:hypothetical protein
VAEAGDHGNNHSASAEGDISTLAVRLLSYQEEFLCMNLGYIKEYKLH